MVITLNEVYEQSTANYCYVQAIGNSVQLFMVVSNGWLKSGFESLG